MMGYLKKGKLTAAMSVIVIVASLAIFSCNLSRNPDYDAIHPGMVHSDIELNLFKDVQCNFDSSGVCDPEDPDFNPDGMLVMAVLAMFADMALEAYPALGECVYMDERAVNFIRSSTKNSGEHVYFTNYATGVPETITITYDEPYDPDFPYYYYGFGNDDPEEAPFVEMYHFDTEYTLTTDGGPDLGATTLEGIVHTPEDFDLEAYWNYGECLDATPCDYTRPYDAQGCDAGVCSQNLGMACTSDAGCVDGEIDYGPCAFCFEQLDEINLAADGGFRINTCPNANEPDQDMIMKWSPGSMKSTFFTVELRVTEATNVIGMIQCNAVDINQEIKIPHEMIQMLPEGDAAFGAFRIREVYQEGFGNQYWMGRATLSVEGEATTYPGCSQDCADADGDDYIDAECGGDDCDDDDAAVNPGMTEGPFEDVTCTDDKDNDCDGDVDSSDSDCEETCVDADGDDYDDIECGGDDCDDSNDAVYPGANEGPFGDPTCADGLDNDCDGDPDSADTNCQDF